MGRPTDLLRAPWRREIAAAVNAAVQAAATWPRVRHVDMWSMFADAGGASTDTAPDVAGLPVPVRQADGAHLTEAATTRVSAKVYALIQYEWAVGSRQSPAPVVSRTAGELPTARYPLVTGDWRLATAHCPLPTPLRYNAGVWKATRSGGPVRIERVETGREGV